MKLIKFIFKTTDGLEIYLIGFFICALLSAIEINFKPYFIKKIVDEASLFRLTNFSFNAGVYLFLQIMGVLVFCASDFLGTLFHSEYRRRIPHIFLKTITEFPYEFYQKNMAGSITAKITDAFNTIFVLIHRTITIFATFFLTIIIALIMLAQINTRISMIALLWVIFYISLSVFFFKESGKYNKDFAPIRPRLYGYIADYISNIMSVWMFTGKRKESKILHKITNDFKRHAYIFGKYIVYIYLIQGLSVVVYSAIILIILANLAEKNLISPGDFVLVLMINAKIGDTIFNVCSEVLGYSQNYGACIQAVNMLDSEKNKVNLDPKIDLEVTKGEIEFDNVCFAYHKDNIIFDNLSILIKPGQKVGLVGYSGSGKSSFVNLILRLYETNKGTITIDKQNIHDCSLESLRKSISYTPQEPILFNRTIAENIAYGMEDRDFEQIKRAAKLAKIDSFINSLPDKYDTIVGDRGIKLSGGQKQRIAIARNFIKNSPIVIMDESTSALDSITENYIQESLTHIIENKTTLIIAHRLSTLKKLQRILVFDNGKIVEDGSHEALLRKDGLYKKLWDSQVGGFLGSAII